jgi:DNA-directed RNA polymerase specialized sigma24 family protein
MVRGPPPSFAAHLHPPRPTSIVRGPPPSFAAHLHRSRPTSTEAAPEGTAELNEQFRKVERYCTGLPEAWVEAMRCVYGAGMSLDDAAAAFGRHRATVYSQLKAAEAQLRERARDSERAAAERAGRPR